MKYFIFFLLIFVIGCEPIVDTLDKPADCIDYSKTLPSIKESRDTISVMTWNIRFGCGTEILWFGDACGSRTILKRDEVELNLDLLIDEINRLKPDVLLLQEVDIKAKRTAYIDQVKYIMDRTYFGFAVYATNWKIQFIPSDGIGRLDEGNAILSVWPITESKLHPLPLRNDLDALTKYFYVRETVQSCKVTMPNGTNFRVINAHLSAFSTDDTKKRQLEEYINILNKYDENNEFLVTGGDYNLLPPNSDSLDYCDEDKCAGESFHHNGDDPLHKDGSNYAPEIDWLLPLYERYIPSLSLDVYGSDQEKYFSHATVPNIPYDRTLDYLFINKRNPNSNWIEGSHITHQDLRKLSDHAPISAKWRIK